MPVRCRSQIKAVIATNDPLIIPDVEDNMVNAGDGPEGGRRRGGVGGPWFIFPR